jgi:hypothetical protein
MGKRRKRPAATGDFARRAGDSFGFTPRRTLVVSVAIRDWTVHSVFMPYRPKKAKKPEAKPGEAGSQSRDYQFLDQRRRDFATRNTLARLRNRKSDIK